MLYYLLILTASEYPRNNMLCAIVPYIMCSIWMLTIKDNLKKCTKMYCCHKYWFVKIGTALICCLVIPIVLQLIGLYMLWWDTLYVKHNCHQNRFRATNIALHMSLDSKTTCEDKCTSMYHNSICVLNKNEIYIQLSHALNLYKEVSS